jgi:hypothetical protein
VNAEFNWWLLIVGLVLGAALTWLVMADSTRREIDAEEAERASEAARISDALSDDAEHLSRDRVEAVLRLHRDYLALPPPDDPVLLVEAPAAPPPGRPPDSPAGATSPSTPPPVPSGPRPRSDRD